MVRRRVPTWANLSCAADCSLGGHGGDTSKSYSRSGGSRHRRGIREQEHQRILSSIPNFYVTYRPDAAPLTTKLKYQLAWKSSTDVVTIGGVAFLAGLQQAGDQYSEFGHGAQGYAKRFGAAYGDAFVSTFLSGAVFPSLFKQDPRYFYRGTGSTKKRILYAISNSVWCKGDNGRWQVNYSNIAGAVSGAALASTYYPSTNPKETLAEVAGTAEISGSVVRKKRPDVVDRPASKLGGRMWAVVRV
jgi:hypothetical protein